MKNFHIVIRLFTSACIVAALIIVIASGVFQFVPLENIETRYLITSIWCIVPFAWGLWSILTPEKWIPRRMTVWGAVLGLIAGVVAIWIVDLPAQIIDV